MPMDLLIRMNDDKTVTVSGPLENKALCYEMLAVGAALVVGWKAESGLVTAPAGALRVLPKGPEPR